jgi:hypothetical protein
MRKWATSKLRTGDLTALAAIVGGHLSTEPDRIDRLAQRGFVIKKPGGQVAVTVAGRAALIVKRLAIR